MEALNRTSLEEDIIFSNQSDLYYTWETQFEISGSIVYNCCVNGVTWQGNPEIFKFSIQCRP